MIAATFHCVFPNEVCLEAVINGKERGYSDAEEIGKIIESGIEVKSPVFTSLPDSRLGKGESAVLALVSRGEVQVVVSDDRQHVSFLTQVDVPHLVPAAVIVVMAQQQILTKAEAREALSRLRPLVRVSSYTEARQELEKLESDEHQK